MTCEIHPTEPREHSHECRCGATWGHTEQSMGCVACHTCPQCGSLQWYQSGSRQVKDIRDLLIALFGRATW